MGADFDVFAIADEQDLAKLDVFRVWGNFRKLDIERIALRDLILFTALFDYCVHFNHSDVQIQTFVKAEYYSNCGIAVKRNIGYF